MFRSHRLSHLPLLSLLALLLVPFNCYSQSKRVPSPLTWEPVKLVNGSPVLFRLTWANFSKVKGEFLGQEINFRYSAGCRCWYALAGVGLNTKPGKYTLHISGERWGMDTDLSFGIRVSAAHYPFSTIKVAPAFVEPPKEAEPQIQAADVAKKQAFSTSDPEPLWSGRFLPPTATETSGVFGSARVYNGVKKSQHLGLDFRASIGTPVHATNAGTVILARPLYFEGNCVMLDHGQGLVTVYMHLSEFEVKEGEKVAAGQLIALSGGTGRSTGPHLHFAVRWHGEYLNPATLLELHPPAR
ncbi:MAG TPA: M23 family metallopeptidase [Candidatus Angelobacter sp.]|nr:M23 family metallopeptidase [Candidatus Angelobacter sp.]